jgi:hypothetical protein
MSQQPIDDVGRVHAKLRKLIAGVTFRQNHNVEPV